MEFILYAFLIYVQSRVNYKFYAFHLQGLDFNQSRSVLRRPFPST